MYTLQFENRRAALAVLHAVGIVAETAVDGPMRFLTYGRLAVAALVRLPEDARQELFSQLTELQKDVALSYSIEPSATCDICSGDHPTDLASVEYGDPAFNGAIDRERDSLEASIKRAKEERPLFGEDHED